MKVYIYCTKAKPRLLGNNKDNYKYHLSKDNINLFSKYMEKNILNGKIVASFDLNKVEEIYYLSFMNEKTMQRFLKSSCLSEKEFCDYAYGKDTIYAWHIDNLQVLDKPVELKHFDLAKAPQSWCYADYNDEKVIIISIKPEWVCKILNGEKAIEVRKTLPKEMMNNGKRI